MNVFTPLRQRDVDFQDTLAFCKVKETPKQVESEARAAFRAANPDLFPSKTATKRSTKTQ